MIASVYAHKSTEQVGVAEAARSVTRQMAGAETFAGRSRVGDRRRPYIPRRWDQRGQFERRTRLMRLLNHSSSLRSLRSHTFP